MSAEPLPDYPVAPEHADAFRYGRDCAAAAVAAVDRSQREIEALKIQKQCWKDRALLNKAIGFRNGLKAAASLCRAMAQADIDLANRSVPARANRERRGRAGGLRRAARMIEMLS